MTKRPAKPPKSDRPKLILAAALAIVLVVILLQQFRGQSSNDLTQETSQDQSDLASPNPLKSNDILTPSTPNQSQPTQSSASRTNSTPTASGTILPPRAPNPSTSSSKKAAELPVTVVAELPRLPHDLIAQNNPFFDVFDIPDASLLNQTDEAPEEPAEPSLENVPEPQIRAVYMTAEGATALIDGQLVPIQNPRPAIEAIKSNWGNDFSQSTNPTENRIRDSSP